MALELRELSTDNLRGLRDLRLADGQERFVAPVLESIAEAYVTPTAWPRAIVDDDQVVGFVMANWDPDNDLEAFRAGIWRLNVDASAQGRGVGRFAVREVAAEAARRDGAGSRCRVRLLGRRRGPVSPTDRGPTGVSDRMRAILRPEDGSSRYAACSACASRIVYE